MFADSLLDTRVSSHRGWTTLASFGLQGVALCGVMLLPLLYTQGLPQIFTANPYITMVSPPGAQPTPPVPRSVQQAQSNMSGIHVLQPSRVPNTIAHIDDHDAPPPIDFG